MCDNSEVPWAFCRACLEPIDWPNYSAPCPRCGAADTLEPQGAPCIKDGTRQTCTGCPDYEQCWC